jgi:hypothetical protein
MWPEIAEVIAEMYGHAATLANWPKLRIES